MMNIDSNKDFYGFTSVGDFLESLFGIKTGLFNTILAVVGGTTSTISGFIWETEAAVYTLWALMAIDWFTGLSYAFKTKTYWSRKNFRMPIYFVCTSLILVLSWHMSKNSVIFTPLPGVVYGGFCAVYFSSLIENMSKLEWLPPQMVKIIEQRFGFNVLFGKKNKTKKDEV